VTHAEIGNAHLTAAAVGRGEKLTAGKAGKWASGRAGNGLLQVPRQTLFK